MSVLPPSVMVVFPPVWVKVIPGVGGEVMIKLVVLAASPLFPALSWMVVASTCKL